jgi:hypothetical protein
MNCDATTLVGLAKCFMGAPFANLQAMKIRLLCAILNGETMTCDPVSLSNSAKCLMGMDIQQMAAIEVSLLCSIAGGGGGGGVIGGVSCGVGAPVAAPLGTCSIYYDTATFNFYAWDSGSSVWVPFIS